ncbi:MAG TPA: subclass B3 metallo-beta-lactamase [Bryobacteraceae bacterium]|nr:subclass B3 metallo-beta-lactamase [Bryobacteraceae bacterium]
MKRLFLAACLPLIPAIAQIEAAWNRPIEPHHVVANIYYVGTNALASFLIVTPQGHILINSDYEESVPLIRASVEKLGYKFADIKWLLSSQAHNDHSAGNFLVKELTGAKSAVMEGDADVISSGGAADFWYGGKPLYKPSKVDRELHDGDTITLGGVTLVAHKTPGHTRGCTTWTTNLEENGRKLQVVIVGGVAVNPGYKLIDNDKYPGIAGDYESTFRTLRELRADVFLGAHGSYYGMDEKLVKLREHPDQNPFIDPQGYQDFVNDAEQAFHKEFAHQKDVQSFEYVWQTVRDKHWQKDPGGLDWPKVHSDFLPSIEKAPDRETARAIMRQMLDRLHQSHFRIIPGDLYDTPGNDSRKTGEITTGMDVRIVAGRALVTSIEPGSGAAKAQVQRGWEIVRIEQNDIPPLLEKAEKAHGGSSLKDLLLTRLVLRLLEGGPGQTIHVQFRDGQDQLVSKTIEQGEPRGVLARFGYLYPMHVWIDTGRVHNVGFTHFNMFLDPNRLLTKFGESVDACSKCDGYVLDLRGNPGGLGVMAMGFAGWFLDKPDLRLGTLYMRDTTLNFVIFPRQHAFTGPLAILVDGTSGSTAEILAGGLKDLGRARIFGTRTAAAALPSFFEILPNGDAFQYAIANYISAGGKALEGNGVIPDVEVPLTREALLAGQDPAFDAAVRWIEGRTPPSPVSH